MKCLGKAFPQIDARNVEILAVSGDTVAKQAKFAAALGLRFKLLSDGDYEVARSYDVFVANPKGGFASRSVFLVNMEGKLHYVNRNFPPPRTLEGTELEEKLKELGGGEPDPMEVVAKLSSPDKEGATALVRLVQAVLREDVRQVSVALHPKFGARPGEPASMQIERRAEEVDRFRTLFRDYEVRGAFRFSEVVDLADVKVSAGEDAKELAALAETPDKRRLADLMAPGDLLVATRTRNPKVSRKDEEGKVHEEEVFPAEILLLVRPDGDRHSIFATAVR